MSLETQTLSLPDQQVYKGQLYPLAFELKTDSLEAACAWITENADQFGQQAASHGAVLLRGLPLASPEDFDAAVTAFNFPVFS